MPEEYPEQHIRDILSDTSIEILGIAKLSHQNAIMSSCEVTVWLNDESKLILPTM